MNHAPHSEETAIAPPRPPMAPTGRVIPGNHLPSASINPPVLVETYSASTATAAGFVPRASAAFTALVPCRALAVMVSEGFGAAVSGKIACKFAVHHSSEALRSFSPQALKNLAREQWSTALLEHSLTVANEALYDFGSRLSAAGRVSGSFSGLIVAGTTVAAVRLSRGSMYLHRRAQLFPFFGGAPAKNELDPVPPLPRLGELRNLDLRVVSSRLKRGDQLLLFSHSLSHDSEVALLDYLECAAQASAYVEPFAEFCERTLSSHNPSVNGELGFGARLILR